MAWDTIPAHQQTEIARIEGKLKQLQAQSNPVTIYSTTTPTQDTLINTFGQTYPPAYSPANFETIQWVDPSTNTLRNQYNRLPDVDTTTILTASTGVMRPLATYPSGNIPFTKLGEIYVDDAGAGITLSMSLANQNFTSVKVFFQVRDSVAATNAAIGIRVNGILTSNYGASWQGANSTFGLGTEVNTGSNWPFVIPGSTSARTYYAQGMITLWDYTTAYRMPRIHLQATSLWGNPYTTSTTTNYNYFGLLNVSGAATAISLVSATGFASGTRLVWFGI